MSKNNIIKQSQENTERDSPDGFGGLQINVPPVDPTAVSNVSKEITERSKHAIDKAIDPTSIPAQNALSDEAFHKMVDSVVNDPNLPAKEKVELCKEIVQMKDRSDSAHAEMVNENIRVQGEVAKGILAKQGLTWDQIGLAMQQAGRIGALGLRAWMFLKLFI